MNYPIGHGGKGRVAPYTTCHYRIPEPIKPTVQRFAATYRQYIDEDKEPKALLQRVEQAIDKTSAGDSASLIEDQHAIARLQEKIAQLEEQNEISAKLLIHTRQDKQESLEKAEAIISQKQAAIERLREELKNAEEAIASQTSSQESDPELEKENLELHAKVGDLDLALQNAQEEIYSLKNRITDLIDKQGLTPSSNFKEVESLLREALSLKANAGGAIKAKIKEALPLIQIPDRD